MAFLSVKKTLITATLILLTINLSSADIGSFRLSFQQKIKNEFITLKKVFSGFSIRKSNKVAPQPETSTSATSSTSIKDNPNKKTVNQSATAKNTNDSVKTTETNDAKLKILVEENNTPGQSTYTLTISNTSGGSIISQDNKNSCYGETSCTFKVASGSTLIFTPAPNTGYAFVDWSSYCVGQKECKITVTKNMTLKASFKPALPSKPSGTITSPANHHTCYIPLGKERCTILVSWEVRDPQDIHLSDNGTEYVIKSEGGNGFIEDLRFDILPGPHEIALKNYGDTLDSITVNAECVAGTYLESSECRAKGAQRLSIFKPSSGAIESEPTGINCGESINDCNMSFLLNTKVTLKFIKRPDGNDFSGWYGDCSGTSPTCVLTMDKLKTIGVLFK